MEESLQGELETSSEGGGGLVRREQRIDEVWNLSTIHSESVKQYARIVWASLISSLEVSRFDCLSHRFSLTFQPSLFSVEN